MNTNISIDKYNECFKGDYHNGVGSYGAQQIDIFPFTKHVVITIVVHGQFKKIMKKMADVAHLMTTSN